MSGGSEADFDLGYRVNVDSHRVLLEAARKETAKRADGQKVIYGEHRDSAGVSPSSANKTTVYTSGLAVYGGDMCKPEAFVDPAVRSHQSLRLENDILISFWIL